ncbi:diphthine--ammonia ligase [Chloroflexota bacterium]
MKNKVFASWSGGKDGCLACYRAASRGLDIRYLVNMVTEDGTRSCSHGISAEVLRMQAQAIDIPLLQRKTSRETYEAEYKNAIRFMKQEGISGGVFGDIDFNPHREWIERLCRDTDIVPYLPLWEESQDKLIHEFVDAGFVSVVVAARKDFFGEEILGKPIDNAFIQRLEQMKNITLCGEAGEYHTLVIDGPIFQKKLEITGAYHTSRSSNWFLEVTGAELWDKPAK